MLFNQVEPWQGHINRPFIGFVFVCFMVTVKKVFMFNCRLGPLISLIKKVKTAILVDDGMFPKIGSFN